MKSPPGVTRIKGLLFLVHFFLLAFVIGAGCRFFVLGLGLAQDVAVLPSDIFKVRQVRRLWNNQLQVVHVCAPIDLALVSIDDEASGDRPAFAAKNEMVRLGWLQDEF